MVRRGPFLASAALLLATVALAVAGQALASDGSRVGVERSSVRAAAHALGVSVTPTRPSASVGRVITIIQTLNNCGPASVAEVLDYWGIHRTQAQVQSVLRADNSGWGMAPYGVPVYARSLGLRSFIGASGSTRQIKALISNGFPVIVNQWVSSGNHIRHYRVIHAYSDRLQTFTAADPYLGAGHLISYSEFNSIWSSSNGRFLVIYPPAKAVKLEAVLRATSWNQRQAYSRELAWQQRRMHDRAVRQPGSWVWYNGYVAIAFDEAMLGRYRQAQADLGRAARAGSSPVMIGWVRQDIKLLQSGGL